MIGSFLSILFGGGRNAIRETLEVFRPNAEAGEVREAARHAAALSQFASEFGFDRKGCFDRFIDGLNRLPRPMLALGTLALFVSAMADPIWFAERMQGVALVPEPLWWLMGAIVSFYFGARHQAKTHDLQRSLAETLSRAPHVIDEIKAFRKEVRPASESRDRELQKKEVPVMKRRSQTAFPENAALEDWRQSRER